MQCNPYSNSYKQHTNIKRERDKSTLHHKKIEKKKYIDTSNSKIEPIGEMKVE